jgi:hypothetical protein
LLLAFPSVEFAESHARHGSVLSKVTGQWDTPSKGEGCPVNPSRGTGSAI